MTLHQWFTYPAQHYRGLLTPEIQRFPGRLAYAIVAQHLQMLLRTVRMHRSCLFQTAGNQQLQRGLPRMQGTIATKPGLHT